MHIALIGDIHGCALHALGCAVGWQIRTGLKLDCVIQVGDFHAYPPETFPDDDWYVANNPAERDSLRVQEPSDRVAAGLRLAREVLGAPMYFISGNHEDFDWLAELHAVTGESNVAIDPLGTFTHIEDGSILNVGQEKVALLGKIDLPGWPEDLDNEAYNRLLALKPGDIDILVTHDNPIGMPPGYIEQRRGMEFGGSKRITTLIEHLQPWLHVGGHIHLVHGPRQYGDTTSYTVTMLVPPKTEKWSGDDLNPHQSVDRGALAIADTTTRSFEFVEDDWLDEIAGDDFDLARYIETLRI